MSKGMFGDWILFLFSKIVFVLFSINESKFKFYTVFNPFFFFLVIVFT